MMRLLGNPFVKSFLKGRLQYRDFSSASEKVVTTSKKIVEYCYKGAFCGVGYVVGGVMSSPVAKQVVEAEEMTVKKWQHLDEREARLNDIGKSLCLGGCVMSKYYYVF